MLEEPNSFRWKLVLMAYIFVTKIYVLLSVIRKFKLRNIGKDF